MVEGANYTLHMIQEIDSFHPLLLNIGYAVHDSDWNWTDVNSPFFRIYYVTKGTAQVTFVGRTITLRPNHLYVIPAFTSHNCSCNGCFEHYYLHIYEDDSSGCSILEDLDLPSEIPAEPLDLELMDMLYRTNPNSQIPHSNPSTYDTPATLMHNIIKNKHRAVHDRVASRGIIYLLLSHFLKDARPKNASTDNRIIKVVNFIRKNINHDIDINTMAEICCLSKAHFIRLFKSEMNITPLQYIVKKKIEKAQLLLITQDMAIKEVAYSLGYDNYSYFTKLFKKQTGLTPHDYKEQNQRH